MKKVFAFLLAVSVLFSVPAFSLAEDEEEDPGLFTCGDWDYRLLEDGTAEIVEYTGLDAQVEIPAELDGFEVSGTGDEMAFPWYAHITGVVIPDSLTRIGRNPFIYCDALAAVTVSPDHPSLEVRDGVLFSKTDGRLICYPRACGQVTYEIPDGTETIGDFAFAGCALLKAVTIPEGLTTIGTSAFCWCENLEKVNIPKSVTSMDEYAFYGCGAVTITVPRGSEYIEYFEDQELKYREAD